MLSWASAATVMVMVSLMRKLMGRSESVDSACKASRGTREGDGELGSRARAVWAGVQRAEATGSIGKRAWQRAEH